MPKMKTHRGAAKRFKITGYRQDPASQGVPGPPARAQVQPPTRRLGRGAEVTGGDKKRVERLLGRPRYRGATPRTQGGKSRWPG